MTRNRTNQESRVCVLPCAAADWVFIGLVLLAKHCKAFPSPGTNRTQKVLTNTGYWTARLPVVCASALLTAFLLTCRRLQPPKTQQKSKEQKMAAAMAGGKGRKKVSRHNLSTYVFLPFRVGHGKIQDTMLSLHLDTAPGSNLLRLLLYCLVSHNYYYCTTMISQISFLQAKNLGSRHHSSMCYAAHRR